jgi:hypothetical protein
MDDSSRMSKRSRPVPEAFLSAFQPPAHAASEAGAAASPAPETAGAPAAAAPQDADRAVAAPAPAPSIGREALRRRLGLAVWEIELAAGTGLLPRGGKGFTEAGAAWASEEPARFAAALEAEHRIKTQEAAKVAGISEGRFREAVADGVFTAVAVEAWKYGPVPLYRRGDITSGAAGLAAWAASRQRKAAVVAPARRAAATARAAATRQRNIAASVRGAVRIAAGEAVANTVDDPVERALACVSWALLLASGLGDDVRRGGASAKRHASALAALDAAKDEAMLALALRRGPLVSLALLDAGQPRYCGRCRGAISESRGYSRDWVYQAYCRRCVISHHYSLVRVSIDVPGHERSFVLPYPIAAAWPISPGAARAPRRREEGVPSRETPGEDLAAWATWLPRFERDEDPAGHDTVLPQDILAAADPARIRSSLRDAVTCLEAALPL